ncbi:GspE/PulE family protein [Ramlibacter sp.]|uniref:GspE/PulE family protein n=1 Tax=Ramlibacter sp. TaxID=1917967 RepID=UPI0035AE7D27
MPETALTPGVSELLRAMRLKRGLARERLEDALRALRLLDEPRLAALRAEDPALLDVHCLQLVHRGLLTREQLGEALAHVTGLPEAAQVDLATAPPALLKVMLQPRPVGATLHTGPARNLSELGEAFALAYSAPLVTLEQSIEALGLLDRASIRELAARDPEIFRGGQHRLVEQFRLTPENLGRALAHTANLPEVDALRFAIDPEALQVLPVRQARTMQVLPLGERDEHFYIASSQPTDLELKQRLTALTGHTVMMVWAPQADILKRLETEESASLQSSVQPLVMEWSQPASATGTAAGNGGGTMVAPSRTSTTGRLGDRAQHVEKVEVIRWDAAASDEPGDVDALVAQAEAEVDAMQGQQLSEAVVGDRSGMARLVTRMIEDARAQGASDIHIELGNPQTVVRFRIDGDLRNYLLLPVRLRAALVSRIKVMARLDIAERRRPQDGRINMADFGQARLELRVAVLPTHDGMENVVMRLLATADPIPLTKLGLQKRDEETIARLARYSFGLVLAAGPTGSGKTTTLHSILQTINTPERKIWTAEDPIEITQPGLNQVQVNAKIGVTFAAAMRSFLRADPDVIMIGEVRDAETAHVAVEASLTGHLVLSTLHTNSAAESVVRLLELGLDALNFADSLRGIVAQRLVRGLCPHCRGWQPLDPEGLRALVDEYIGPTGIDRAEAERRLMAAAGVSVPAALQVAVAVGCEHCGGKGYKGRMGVYEILENSPGLRDLIQRRARTAEINAMALESGMRCLRHDALEKAVQGKLDLIQARAAFL